MKKALLYFALLFIIVQSFFLKSFGVTSSSMMPTLRDGDYVLVNRMAYGLKLPRVGIKLVDTSRPRRGDVVVFYSSRWLGQNSGSKYLVKRVVGVPGDVVEIKSDLTYINGYPTVEDRYVNLKGEPGDTRISPSNVGSTKLFEDEYYVLGDNRVNSEDSRMFGPLSEKDIIGRAALIFWSWGDTGISWERAGKKVK